MLMLSVFFLAAPPDFDADVAPLLAAKCLSCHAGTTAKGGLDLGTKAGARAGGDSGPALTAESLLHRVTAGEMPPKKPLAPAEQAILAKWNAAGAPWGTSPIDPLARTTATRGGREWWAYQPLRANPGTVDDFLRAKRTDAGLTASAPASPRSLVRRVAFDLTGLPPSPEVVAAFAVNPTEAAYAKLVDDLLASPHYGERQARLWLDVVRYGESDGFERNMPRPTAWPYRDWVVRAFNDDLPYDRFAKLQLAGDAEGVPAATGMLVAGLHNTVLGSNAAANQTARQDELEDIVAAVAQGFLGLSVQCARCHDHKFDAIRQADYYRLAAALGGVNHGERELEDPVRRRREAELRAAIATAETGTKTLERLAAERLGAKSTLAPLMRWNFDAADGTLKGGAKLGGGRLKLDGKEAHLLAAPLGRTLRAKTLEAWVRVGDLDQRGGGIMTVETPTGNLFDALVFAEQAPRRWIVGSNFFARTQDLRGPDETAPPGETIHLAATFADDGRIRFYRDGRPYGEAYAKELATFPAEARVVFGMRHTGGGKAFFHGDIDEARLYDRALSAEEVVASHRAGPDATTISAEKLLAALSADERAMLAKHRAALATATAELAALPKPALVFAVASKAPPKTFVLARGDVRTPTEEVSAGGLSAFGASDFGNTPTDPERRASLANWIVRTPTFARVAVNRIWQSHFGIGLVETPSDLGFNGGRPSHPELLDALAAEFVAGGFRMKALHRKIVTSEAYKQSATRDAHATAKDAGNRTLWRKTPTRLDAEAVRDAILAVSGELNRTVGGPPFHDVRTYFLGGTTYYEPLDPAGPAFQRRTLYRFAPRGERSALLETFDCPDPSAQTPRRPTTTTPLQALALWNGAFVLRRADRFAERANRDAEPVRFAYSAALAREPTDAEFRDASALVAGHGMAALARVLFNCNEFVVIE